MERQPLERQKPRSTLELLEETINSRQLLLEPLERQLVLARERKKITCNKMM